MRNCNSPRPQHQQRWVRQRAPIPRGLGRTTHNSDRRWAVWLSNGAMNTANNDAEDKSPLADTTIIKTIAFIKEFIVEDGGKESIVRVWWCGSGFVFCGRYFCVFCFKCVFVRIIEMYDSYVSLFVSIFYPTGTNDSYVDVFKSDDMFFLTYSTILYLKWMIPPRSLCVHFLPYLKWIIPT